MNFAYELHPSEIGGTGLEQRMASTSMEAIATTSDVNFTDRMQKGGYDQLPNELHGMKIQDKKADSHDDKVNSAWDWPLLGLTMVLVIIIDG